MKKLLSILAVISALSFTATAQDQPRDRMQNAGNNKDGIKHGKQDHKKMMKEMGLSKQQKVQLKELKKSNMGKREEIQNDKTLSDQQKKEKMMQLHKEQQEKMGAILTPEQREKMKEKMKENRNKYPQSPKQRDPVVKNPDNK